MVERMADLANDEEVVLAQQIVNVVNAACLRIFYRYQAVLNFSGGNCSENLAKTTTGKRLDFVPKISSVRVTAKVSSLTLKCSYKITCYVTLSLLSVMRLQRSS